MTLFKCSLETLYKPLYLCGKVRWETPDDHSPETALVQFPSPVVKVPCCWQNAVGEKGSRPWLQSCLWLSVDAAASPLELHTLRETVTVKILVQCHSVIIVQHTRLEITTIFTLAEKTLPFPPCLEHLCFATAWSLPQSDPALVSWSPPSHHPAGPGTGTGSSRRPPCHQMADKVQQEQNTAFWLNICGNSLYMNYCVIEPKIHIVVEIHFLLHIVIDRWQKQVGFYLCMSTSVSSCCSRRLCSCRWPSVSCSSSKGPSSQACRLTLMHLTQTDDIMSEGLDVYYWYALFQNRKNKQKRKKGHNGIGLEFTHPDECSSRTT